MARFEYEDNHPLVPLFQKLVFGMAEKPCNSSTSLSWENMHAIWIFCILPKKTGKLKT